MPLRQYLPQKHQTTCLKQECTLVPMHIQVLYVSTGQSYIALLICNLDDFIPAFKAADNPDLAFRNAKMLRQ